MKDVKSLLIGSLFGMSALALPGCVAATGDGLSGQENSGMAKGRGYFMRECSKCHRYIMPSERLAEEWQKILAGKKNKVSLTGVQFQQLSEYVMAESSRTPALP